MVPTHISISPLNPSHTQGDPSPPASGTWPAALHFIVFADIRQTGRMGGQMGRTLFSSSQSSPPEARSSGGRTRVAAPEELSRILPGGGGEGCSSPDRHNWHSVAASASVETLERDSGPGGLWDPQHCLWPVKNTHTHTCIHLCPSQHKEGRAHTVKPASFAAGRKEENSILTTKWDSDEGREIPTHTVLYWLTSANF